MVLEGIFSNLLLKHLKQHQELSRSLSLLVILGVVRLHSYLNLHLSEGGGEDLLLSQKWFSMAKILFVKLLSASLLVFLLQGFFLVWFFIYNLFVGVFLWLVLVFSLLKGSKTLRYHSK